MCIFAGAFGAPLLPETIDYENLIVEFTLRSTDRLSVTHWDSGSLFFGSRSQLAQMEASETPMPSTGMAVAFSGFLANKLELEEELGLEREITTYGTLIARAYRVWGQDLVSHLEGRFAFILWDENTKIGIVARDHFGQTPLYYSSQKDRLYFGADVRMLLAFNAVQPVVNQQSVQRYLAKLPPAYGETYFQEVRSLPAGHLLIWQHGEVRISRYWTTPVDVNYTEMSFPQQVSHFNRLFAKAIRPAFSASRAPVFFMSGGLDSSSITATARRLFDVPKIQAVSMILSEDQRMNEQGDQRAVSGMGGIDVLEIDGSKIDYLGSVDQILYEQAGPTLAAGLGLSIHSHLAAESLGADSVFDGHGGDETVSYGYGRLFELRRDKLWLTFFYELFRADPNSALIHLYNFSTSKPPLSYIRKATSLAFPSREMHPFEKSGPHFLARDIELSPDTPDPYYTTPPHPERIEQTSHISTIADPLQSFAFETLNNVASRRQYQMHYPLWDKDLVEFCLSLPAASKRRHGYDRFILREAMRGILAEQVRTKRRKCDFSGVALNSLRRDSQEEVDSLFQNRLGQYSDLIDLEKSAYVYSKYKTADSSVANGFLSQSIWKLTSLTRWIEDPMSKAYKPALPKVRPRIFQSFLK